MPTWAWVLVAIGATGLIGFLIAETLKGRHSFRLGVGFGPEYDRAVEPCEIRREAEAELGARQARHDQFQPRSLSPAARRRYLETWEMIQVRFVDDPRVATGSADNLIQSVMAERGYPVEDLEQRTADLSVEHSDVVDAYPEGHLLADRGRVDESSTEALRQAMRYYRILFDHLVLGDESERPGREPVDTAPRSR
jgi:hypothetical protein